MAWPGKAGRWQSECRTMSLSGYGEIGHPGISSFSKKQSWDIVDTKSLIENTREKGAKTKRDFEPN